MEIAFFKQHMMVMGDFFFNGYKEEYPNCKFPTFNSGKTIERQVERGLHEQYSFDEVRRPEGEWFYDSSGP
jgi:hypothetical protein